MDPRERAAYEQLLLAMYEGVNLVTYYVARDGKHIPLFPRDWLKRVSKFDNDFNITDEIDYAWKPRELTLAHLFRLDIPLDWQAQRQALGF